MICAERPDFIKSTPGMRFTKFPIILSYSFTGTSVKGSLEKRDVSALDSALGINTDSELCWSCFRSNFKLSQLS